MKITEKNKAIDLSLKQYQILCTIIANTSATNTMNSISYKNGMPSPNHPNKPIVINNTNTCIAAIPHMTNVLEKYQL
jgi:hypothetical protein